MAVIETALVGAVQFVARQAASSASSSLDPTSTTQSASSITSTASPAASTTSNGGDGANGDDGGGGGGGGGSNSPLLFFVALGFGVVFTNLWIIVGVKYCFRYNARNRQLRLNEDGEPINLENVPRPHRRRREKKLMTMDEVNDKFPMMKYKNWVLERAKEGLPTAGGVSVPASGANSVRSADGIVPQVAPEAPSGDRDANDASRTASATATPAAPATTSTTTNTDQPDQGTQAPLDEKSATTSAAENGESTARAAAPAPTIDHYATAHPDGTTTEAPLQRVTSADDDDDEHINAALPPELLETSGDTCAICIDALEDDDDVRGLTCGHTFHAVCVDPWLTSRRACCPLCKTDYYIPKPRPQPGDPNNPNAGSTMDGSNMRMNLPNAPPAAWYDLRNSRWGFGGRIGGFMPSGTHTRNARSVHRPRPRPRPRPRRRPTAPVEPEVVQPRATSNQTNLAAPNTRRWPFQLPWRRNRDTEAPSQNETEVPMASGANPTPSQLESGILPASGGTTTEAAR
ncbi:hypothetical protein ACRALDRAFT_2042874 [Sodiomyces alcalophilus JCM 7366]|uniref:uncharacterized protein n=1 Tax=Sodiomyces alcalophilus JCM 7366 TaxID=591952 RepID=UPI0039B64300